MTVAIRALMYYNGLKTTSCKRKYKDKYEKKLKFFNLALNVPFCVISELYLTIH